MSISHSPKQPKKTDNFDNDDQEKKQSAAFIRTRKTRMAGKRLDFAIPLQSNVNTEETPSLPSSPTAADADLLMDLPFVTPSYSLAIQSKRALIVRNALVASKCTCV